VARLQETKLINPIYDGSLEAMFNTAALNELMRTSFKSFAGAVKLHIVHTVDLSVAL